MLHGRATELAAVSGLLAEAREGRSGVLVLRGEPGIGKTALVEHAVASARAEGLPVLQGLGVEFEAELPYAGLHMLLHDRLGGVAELPDPQRRALETAFGLASGPAPEPMLVGLAVLTLLSEPATETPLLLAVDDAQWWDRDSAHALFFAVRRLHAEGVALVLATREEGPVSGFGELRLGGLDARAASALVDEHFAGLDVTVRYRVLAESRGNPLALRELPLSIAAEPAGAGSGSVPLTDRLRQAFHGTASGLPPATRTLLLLAALEPSGSLAVIASAAAALGAGTGDLPPAEHAGLVRVEEGRVVFRHPLVASAVHEGAAHGERLAAHRALAGVLDAPGHADRRAWHLAQGATGADESVARALEETADRARARGGQSAACAAYTEAARLSADEGERGRRLVLAAESAAEAGFRDRAAELAARVGAPIAPELRGRLAYLRTLHAFWAGDYTLAHRLTIDEAEHHEPEHAAELLGQALHFAWYLGEDELADTASRLAALRLPAGRPRAEAVAFIAGGILDETPPVLADVPGATLGDRLMMCGIGVAVGQDAAAYELATRLATEIRALGGWGRLPTALFFAAEIEVFQGRYSAARETATEAMRLAGDSGQPQWTSQFSAVLAYLDAVAGDEEECRRHAAEAMADIAGGAMSPGAPWARAALARLDLGAGRVTDALAGLERLTRTPTRHHICTLRAVPDMVEAAVRIGSPERAVESFGYFAAWARRVGRPWALALTERCRALLADDDTAEKHFTAAAGLHERERQETEAGRTALLHGEWLRRARRKAEARDRLRHALDVFERAGMRPWAERARVELEATGQSAGAREEPGPLSALTPQEARIVRLAAAGMSNKDIAARLFLSPRTVGYHLYKAYPKLGVLSRGELAGVVG
ncbi:AAA family ATPase [Phytomonospora sp. NPDC050363]|uniref:ATP-binding protein n=1 Tax=Phytomonospora sp. NPDC050363 TaxID=3155642 RepID=UPI0033C63B8E